MNIQNSTSGIYLGVDYGSKKTGIAIGQKITKDVRPLKIITNDPIPEILIILSEWDIEKIIIGYPQYKNEGEIHKEIKLFVKKLKKSISKKIDIILVDESYSSSEGRRKKSELDNMRVKGKNLDNYDDLSACIILQSWINENIII